MTSMEGSAYLTAAEIARERRRNILQAIVFLLLSPILLPLCLVLSPLWLVRKYQASDRYEENQRKKKEERDRMPPKFTQRKRALSTSEQSKNAKSTKQQQQSRLRILPIELRLQIFEIIVGAREGIHIVFLEGSLHCYRCQWSRDLTVPARHIQCWNFYCNNTWINSSKIDRECVGLGVLGLLQSCRFM